MEDNKILKAFYIISKELEENLIKLESLEVKLKHAKEQNDINYAKTLLKDTPTDTVKPSSFFVLSRI